MAYYLSSGYLSSGITRWTGCTVEADGEILTPQPQQAANASTTAAVATSHGLAGTRADDSADVDARVRAAQSRPLDQDSPDLFQQRPSQGRGTVAQ